MEPSETKPLCFVSWNVNGVLTKINSTRKICHVTKELKVKDAEIVFLQETHIGSENLNTFETHTTGWRCFFTVYDSKSKGVAILIKEDVPFKYISHDEDYSGGYLVLFCCLYGELFTLVNVYNHKDDKDVLNRLQEYLRETAEGVLVVGGDFNTVLDLTLDQKKSTGHTPLRYLFERFTSSLSLMDTWAHSHPTKQKFTHSQEHLGSFSRLDMFLMPDNVIERVSEVSIWYTNPITIDMNDTRKISDHNPVVLKLSHSICTYRRDDTVGQINGAEILSAINSLTDSQQEHPDGINIQTYKMHRKKYSETLKESFNTLLNSEKISKDFKKNTIVSGNRKVFNVRYLIFTMILAKRLNMLQLVPPENKSQSKNNCYIVRFKKNPVTLKWTFLIKVLSALCKAWSEDKKDKQQPQGDFRILEALGLADSFRVLDNILLKVSSSPDDVRELQQGCPLTNSILSLLLKYMQIILKTQYETYICSFRQGLIIYGDCTDERYSDINLQLKEFHENGTELSISKMTKS